MEQQKRVNTYKSFIGKEVDTNSGKAVIVKVCGKYGTLGYKECDGIGWIDLSILIEE